MEPILVTGGTGMLGRHVVRRLSDAEHGVRVLTRRTDKDKAGVRFVSGDLLSGTGIDAAVDGVATINPLCGKQQGR